MRWHHKTRVRRAVDKWLPNILIKYPFRGNSGLASMNQGRLEDQALTPSRVPAGLAVHRSPSIYQIADTWKEHNGGFNPRLCLYLGREVEMCAPVLSPKGLRLSGGGRKRLFFPPPMQPHFWMRRLRIIIIRALHTTEGG